MFQVLSDRLLSNLLLDKPIPAAASGLDRPRQLSLAQPGTSPAVLAWLGWARPARAGLGWAGGPAKPMARLPTHRHLQVEAAAVLWGQSVISTRQRRWWIQLRGLVFLTHSNVPHRDTGRPGVRRHTPHRGCITELAIIYQLPVAP